jgi:5-methylcytosine-specific restriction protein A
MPSKPPTVGHCAGNKSWNHGRRESRHTRGYGTAWDKLRKRILARDRHLCQPCYRATPQRITPGTQVDHIRPKAAGGTDADDNLEAICRACHDLKTLADQGKSPRRRARFGADGWPIED